MLALPKLFGVIVTLSTLLPGNDAVTTEILQPIRSTGDEVGLIFIPGHLIAGEQYRDTARAIQEASQLRVWVVLTDNYYLDVADAQQTREALENAITDLRRAGIATWNFVGVGHGMGGHSLQVNAANSGLKAIVLMGSSLPRDVPLNTYPIPVLTLAAELDGMTRISRIAEEYNKMSDAAEKSFFQNIFRTPVVYIEGANHAQFASGDMPNAIQKGDLPANISDAQAQSMVGQHVDNFLKIWFSSDNDAFIDARENFIDVFFQAVTKFEPFMDMKRLDYDGYESIWTVLAQEFFADEYNDQLAITNNVVGGNMKFLFSVPTLSRLGDVVLAETTTSIHFNDKANIVQVKGDYESPNEIAMKLISKDSIHKALDVNNTSLFSKHHDCRDLNRLALALALTVSSEEVRERYQEQGRPVIFWDDDIQGSNFLWAARPIQIWETEEGLNVKSVAMVTSATRKMGSGVHYCKVMSPYRALEWVNMDSLRPFVY